MTLCPSSEREQILLFSIKMNDLIASLPFEETLALLSEHRRFVAALLRIITGGAVVVNLFPSLQTVGFLSASVGDFLRSPQ